MHEWTPSFVEIDHPSWPHPVQAAPLDVSPAILRYGPGPLSFEGLAAARPFRSLRAVRAHAKAELDAVAAPGPRAARRLFETLLAHLASPSAPEVMQGPHRLDIVALATDRLGLRLWRGLQPVAHLPAPEDLWRHSLHVPDLAPGRRLSDPDRRAVLDAPPESSAHARLARRAALSTAIDALLPHVADGAAWRSHLLQRLDEIGAPLG
jgi:hypothetical protein